jgi:hypothetical protein
MSPEGQPSYARAAPGVRVCGLGRLFEERVSTTSNRDLRGLFDVRRCALVSVRVAVTVAVN